MANEVANRAASAIASLSNLKSGLQNVSQTIVSRGGDPYLRLLQDGSWVYGADNVEVEEGSLWAVNPHSLQHGWVSWTDNPGKQANEIAGEVMVPMTSPLPDVSGLRDTGWPWSQQLSIQVQCVSGEDTGTAVLYKVTSVGGTNAVKGLINKLLAQLDVDPAHPVPVVELGSDSYPHKKYGKTYVPELNISSWSAMDSIDLDAQAEGEAGDGGIPAEATAPVQEQTRAASPTARQQAADALLEQEAARAAAASGDAPVRRRRAR